MKGHNEKCFEDYKNLDMGKFCKIKEYIIKYVDANQNKILTPKEIIDHLKTDFLPNE